MFKYIVFKVRFDFSSKHNKTFLKLSYDFLIMSNKMNIGLCF